jgi:hypothetical protein
LNFYKFFSTHSRHGSKCTSIQVFIGKVKHAVPCALLFHVGPIFFLVELRKHVSVS